jgi:hypothetical protein
MKKNCIAGMLGTVMMMGMVMTGCANKQAAPAASTESAPAPVQAESKVETEETVEIANPWRECTEEEAHEACMRLFKAPDGAVVNGWSLMEVESDENGVPGPLVQLDFRMDGVDFTARAEYGADPDEDISGEYVTFDSEEDVTLANWGEGNMPATVYRCIEDGWTIDVCTWYDYEIGIAYALIAEAEDLDGFDIQAVAEQMYDPSSEPYTGEDEEEAEAAGVNGQNPMINFVGQYYAGRGNLSVSMDTDDTALIQVWWGSSASEHSEWVMHGTYNESTNSIDYTDCEKHEYTLDENGEVVSDVVAYTDGTGSVILNDDGSITWIDDQEHIADDLKMTY